MPKLVVCRQIIARLSVRAIKDAEMGNEELV